MALRLFLRLLSVIVAFSSAFGSEEKIQDVIVDQCEWDLQELIKSKGETFNFIDALMSFDRDDDGHVSEVELKEFLVFLNVKESCMDFSFNELLSHLDSNKDGSVHRSEM
eukprot:TRINITY_DN58346_c0_g1_i1.p1 TRINITY_DN58346_c0_g1~~TRINITY_DN58346_c0_g1_i1.p1  ORF type:complete len:110 (-),score=30.04 TRINITY_DN58346_c0_g1_i1:189-518(-)